MHPFELCDDGWATVLVLNEELSKPDLWFEPPRLYGSLDPDISENFGDNSELLEDLVKLDDLYKPEPLVGSTDDLVKSDETYKDGVFPNGLDNLEKPDDPYNSETDNLDKPVDPYNPEILWDDPDLRKLDPPYKPETLEDYTGEPEKLDDREKPEPYISGDVLWVCPDDLGKPDDPYKPETLVGYTGDLEKSEDPEKSDDLVPLANPDSPDKSEFLEGVGTDDPEKVVDLDVPYRSDILEDGPDDLESPDTYKSEDILWDDPE